MTVHFEAPGVTLHHGDCIEVMRTLPAESVDAVVTDPPYGLEFMGKEWDGADGFRRSLNPEDAGRESVFGRTSRKAPEYNTGRGVRVAAERASELTERGKGHSTSAGPYLASGVDSIRVAGRPFQEWCEVWAREALRVLKPGGHMLAFGGSRTWHRLASAVEDAGFEIRDSIAWLYGSGFPKSLDVSKAVEKLERGDLVRAKLLHFAAARGIDGRWLEAQGVASASSFKDWTIGGHVPSDRNWEIVKAALEVTAEEEAAFEREVISHGRSRAGDGTVYGLGHGGKKLGAAVTEAGRAWEGWGTALKPAFEPIVVGRKPLVGTVAANVALHGSGALNIDATRIAFASDQDKASAMPQGVATALSGALAGKAQTWESATTSPTEPSTTASTTDTSATSTPEASAESAPGTARTVFTPNQSDLGRWPTNVVLDESQAEALDAQTGTLTSGKLLPHHADNGKETGTFGAFGGKTGRESYGDSGGASRFFPTFRYEAKAGRDERPNVDGVQHPTVKPLELMRWLCRLVTVKGGTILEPFAGSGTTLEAALLEGFEVIGIEREADYLPLIEARLTKPLQVAMFGDWDGAA